MILLGLVGFLQATVLPGVLILRLARFRGGLVQTLAYVLGLSLLANYLLVWLLVELGLYSRVSVLVIAAIEAAGLAWLCRSWLAAPLGVHLHGWNAAVKSFFLTLFPPVSDSSTDRETVQTARAVMLAIAGTLALSSILWMLHVFRLNLGTIFQAWDAVLSWNTWAAQWAQGYLPFDTGSYPQLLPANWSLTYAAMGSTSVQFFAKATTPLFFLFILLLLFDLGLDARSVGLLLAVTAARLMMKKFLGEYVADGYADFPVAMMAFLPVYALLKVEREPDPNRREMGVWLGAAFAAGAAVTKQSGAYILALYPLLAYLLALRLAPGLDSARRRRLVWLPFAMAVLVASPWYVRYQVGLLHAAGSGEPGWMTAGIYNWTTRQTIIEKLVHGFSLLEKYAALPAFTLLALPLMRRGYRWLAALVVLPFTVLWAAFISYDTRNLALAMPVMALCAGAGVDGLLDLALRGLERLRPARVKLWALLVLLLVIIAAGLLYRFPAAELEASQLDQQRQLFNPELNQKLYAFAATEGAPLKVLTNYPLHYLPGFENSQVQFTFTDYDTYRGELDDPSVGYLLAPLVTPNEIAVDIEARLADGRFELVFEDDHFVPYRLIRIIRRTP